MKPKKPKASEPSVRDKLSAAFLKAFQSDFESFGIEAIEKLREENPAKYAEIASRLIAVVEPPLEGFEGCRTPRDLGIALLKSVGANEFEMSEDMITGRLNAMISSLMRCKQSALLPKAQYNEPTLATRKGFQAA